MEKIVRFADDQILTPDDMNELGDFARESLDHVVKNGIGAGYVGFGVVATGQTKVTIGNGLLFDGTGAVHFRNDEGGVEIDFLSELPAVALRYAAILIRGTGEQPTQTEGREFLIDADTGATESRPTSTENWRQAEVTMLTGAENLTASKPTTSAIYTVVAWVLLDNTGIVSIEMNEGTRLRSARDAWVLSNLNKLAIAALEPQLRTLGSDLSRFGKTLDLKADKTSMIRVQQDMARVKERVDLPDDYVDYGSDRFLDLLESDTGSAGYAALIEEGLRFPWASTSTIALGLLSGTDPAVVTKGGVTLPAYEPAKELRWRAIIGNSGDMALNSIATSTAQITQANMARYRARMGTPFIVSSASAWWKGGAYTDSVRGIFQKNGENFQALPTGEIDPNGHRLYRVTKNWNDTVDTPYWLRTSVPLGINFVGVPWVQTFLMEQDLIITGISVPFSRLDSSGDVHFGICEVREDGSPNLGMMLNMVTVPYNQLSTQSAISPKYAFTPTYLKAGKRYGLAIITAANHWVYIADQIANNPGTLFYSTGGGYFQADATKNILIDFWYPEFTRTRTEVSFNAVELGGGMAALDILMDMIIPDQCSVSWVVGIGGIWSLFDPAGPSPFASLPAVAQLKAVILGTPTMQPMFKLAGSQVKAMRPATALRHQSTPRTLPGPSDEVIEKVRLEHYVEATHDCALKIRVGGADVNPTATTDRLLDDGSIERTSVFMLGAPTSAYARVITGATASAASLFVTSEITDVAA